MAHADRLRLDQAPRLQLCVPDWVSPINSKTIQIEHPRGVSNLGQWDIGGGMGRFRGDIETCAPAMTLGRAWIGRRDPEISST
ncbi:hypothetical protein EN933_37420 [Mesorhizobium sp. M7A.F.Ca.US.001.01.1.1]|nr:hypothetical protein EN933_37420 [Mesorhizobium sp. M7A.F.Ca.US.001.01.1.1]